MLLEKVNLEVTVFCCNMKSMLEISIRPCIGNSNYDRKTVVHDCCRVSYSDLDSF